MAFVDVGIGTAMLYGAMAGAGAGAIYNGVQGKNVLNGALIGGAGGALLGAGAAGIAGASWGGAAADMVAADVASMTASGLAPTAVAQNLMVSYGMSASEAAAAAGVSGGASGLGTAAQGIMAANSANSLANASSGVPGAVNSAATAAPQVSAASTPTQVANAAAPSAAANTPQANTSFFKHPLDWMQANPGSTAAGLGLAGLMGYGIYGNKGNNLLPQYNAVQPTRAMSSTLSPNYRGYFQAKEGGIARLAEGGTPTITSMTPDVAPAAIGPANQPTQLSAATQQLLSQYGVNPQQAQQGIAALKNTGLVVKPAADGGLMQNGPEHVNFMGQDMYPQSQQEHSYYATPTQMPTSAQQTMASYEPNTNPLTGQPTAMASGGVAGGGYHLGGYSDGGRLLKGPGDGMSDEIPATIGHKQPARLADGEFVVPADVVSHLGNGSTDAGAKHLYKMMDKVRTARVGHKKQGKQIKADKFLPK